MDSTRLCTRRNRGNTGHGLTALALTGCLLSVAAQSGCENRQVAVIFLKNRAPEATSLGAYYKLNEPTYRSAGVRQNLDRFGIEAQLGTTGDLDVQVFSYANDVPCSLGSGTGTVHLPGEFRQNLNIDLSTTVSTCSGGQEPAGFPTQNMAVWAKAANDIWFVGDGGKILRWNGEHYTTVALPTALAAKPPNWTSIVGTSRGEVLIAGTNGYVLRWSYATNVLEQLAVNPVSGAMITGLSWRAMSTADASVGDVWLVGTGGIVGVYSPAGLAKVDAYALSCSTGFLFGRDLNSVSCVASSRSGVSPLYDCWFTADAGTLIRRAISATTNCYIYPIISNPPVTQNLTGVWVGANVAANRFDLRIVGSGTTILRGTAPLSDAIPAPASFDSYKGFLPANFTADFLAIGSAPDPMGRNSVASVWVAGNNGTLLRWDDTPQIPGSQIPFTLVNTRVKRIFDQLSAFSDGVVTTGPAASLFYAGTLFSPRT